jgi:hypothetical protein
VTSSPKPQRRETGEEQDESIWLASSIGGVHSCGVCRGGTLSFSLLLMHNIISFEILQ